MRPFPLLLRPIISGGVVPVRWTPCVDQPGYFLPANDEARDLFWAMTDDGVLTAERTLRPISTAEIAAWASNLCIVGD
jgi:hypothetical protein